MKKLLAFVDNSLLKWAVVTTLVFTALYPKLPSIHIVRTWVYIRLEDFLIAGVVAFWLLQLLRRKVKLAWPLGAPIGIYWAAGLLSLLFSLLFIAPHLANFFSHVAILQYFRRIEYMILFFVAFSTIKSVKDVRDYVIALSATLVAVILYGFGQKFYLDIWGFFPDFFVKHPFCFPSFQTGNEEFAKGMALCLPKTARITSTFGGHYDLAAYFVVVLPLLLGIFVAVKKFALKIGVALLFVTGLMLLLFTASRISFTAYLFGAILALFFLKQKKLLIPVIAISIVLLLTFSGSTAKRFLETFRIVNVVTNNQGQVVGLAETKLPETLKKKIAKEPEVIVEAPPPTENLPTGSSFITLPQTSVATKTAIIKKSIPTKDSLRLKLANGGLEISTVSGSFLIQKALVYDISFTTRFQAEWPTAWAAFMKNPPLGTGYSSITLASDNDYLRLLGESGFLGFGAFTLIFIFFAIYLSHAVKTNTEKLPKAFALGLAGGVGGLIANASLIDVFEASKVAEPLWILLGVAVGGLALTTSLNMDYFKKVKSVVTSHTFLIIYLLLLVFIFFGGGLTNFFVADDFTWLKWAASSTPHDLGKYFVDSQGFFYRPLDKVVMYFMYSFFSFQPQGYHLVSITLHFLLTVGWYIIGLQVFKKKQWAMLLAVLFVMLPIHAETLFWISTLSTSLCSVFILYGVIFFIMNRQTGRKIWYLLSLVSVAGALFSYEMGIIAPLLLFISDVFLMKKSIDKKLLLSYIPFALLDIMYFLLRSRAHVAPVGGDYAYSLSHAIPNIIGNFVGYIVATFGGERVLSYMWMLRSAVRFYALPMAVALILAVVGVTSVVVKQKKMLISETARLMWFGLIFSFVTLLPFLPLGNMTERYGYLASGGFAFIVVIFLKKLTENIKQKVWWGMLVLAGIMMIVLFRGAINRELSQWQKASTITYETLGYFRLEKPGLYSGSSLYMINIPIKYGNAWIFPVGLSDGLWFIYRDPSLKLFQEKSFEDAHTAIKDNPSVAPAKDYIFEFDKNGELSEIENL